MTVTGQVSTKPAKVYSGISECNDCIIYKLALNTNYYLGTNSFLYVQNFIHFHKFPKTTFNLGYDLDMPKWRRYA